MTQPSMTTSKEPILVPKLLAWAAQENPDGVARRDPLFSWDDVQSLKTLPWRETTWKDFNQLIDAGAFLLSERGWPVRGKNEQQVTEPIKVAAFLSTELASTIALYALIKCGGSVLLASPRNSMNVLVDMLVQEGIERIIFSPVYEAVAKSVGDELAKRQVGLAPTLAPIPSQEELDDRKETCGVFPYELDDELEWKRPIWSVHTSGSSGTVPTICPYTHQILVETSRSTTLGNIQGENHISLAPLFHLMVHIRGPIYCALNRDTVTTGPMGPPPSATQLAALISKSNCDGITVIPQLLKALTELPGGVDILKRLKWIRYGGSGLPNETKRILDGADVNYINSYGLSEASALADGNPDRWPANVKLDREWISDTGLHTLKFEFFSKASDGVPDLYELIALAGDIPCSVSNVPGGYATGDLVERHPDYPEWFRIWGRKKAIVVLANGENAPIRALEEALEAHPWVRTALVYGTARPQVGVLVELDPEHAVGKGNQEADAAARNELWPTIEKVNAELPDFARLFKSMILFASPEVPIPRTDKGTPKRQVAMKMYEDDIDNLYTSVAAGTGAAVQFNSVDQESLQKMVISILHTIYGDDKEINPDTSLTLELGQDSLRATMTRTSIVASLRAASQSGNVPELAGFMPDDVPTLIAYQYSTPATLAHALHELVKGITRSPHDTEASEVELMRQLVKKYSDVLKSTHRPNGNALSNGSHNSGGRVSTPGSQQVVLLTGSTGAFGTCLLEQLVDNANVHQVICVIRSASSDQAALKARQVTAFVSKNLDPAPAHSPKVQFLHGNPSEDHLQIPEEVTTIIHAAWSVNFNLSLQDLVPEIEGTVRLLQHCQRTGARLVFASSVSTVMGAPPEGQGSRFIEEDEDAPLEWAVMGYGRSKAVVEKLISSAVHEAGVEAMSIRFGQITGDSRSGAWNAQERVPSIFRSATALSALPDDMGTVDWLTVNDAMQVTVAAAIGQDITSATSASKQNVVNLVNPNKVPWLTAVKAFQAHMPSSVELLPTREWFQRLLDAQKRTEAAGDFERASVQIPVLKLVSSFGGRVGQAMAGTAATLLQVKEAIRLSQGQLLSATAIDEHTAGLYLQFWESQTKQEHARA